VFEQTTKDYKYMDFNNYHNQGNKFEQHCTNATTFDSMNVFKTMHTLTLLFDIQTNVQIRKNKDFCTISNHAIC